MLLVQNRKGKLHDLGPSRELRELGDEAQGSMGEGQGPVYSSSTLRWRGKEVLGGGGVQGQGHGGKLGQELLFSCGQEA